MTSRVLLINDFYLGGGAEGVCRGTYELLARENINVDVFYGKEKASHPKSFMSYLYNKQIRKDLTIKLSLFIPSVIHIHNYYHFLSPSIFLAIREYRKKYKVKVVFTAHDYHLICPSSGLTVFDNNGVENITPSKNIFSKNLFKSLDHRGLRYSLVKKVHWFLAIRVMKILNEIDHIVSPSYFLKYFFENSNIKTPISIVRNPMNLSVPNDLKELKTPTNKEVRILFMGRLSQEKGLKEFLLAFDKIKIKNVFLDVLGIGALEKELKDLVVKNNIKNVTFHGFQHGEVLTDFLIKSNVLLLPSIWYENAPLSIIEGAAYGNVILARNLGGMAELAKLTSQYELIDNWKKELESAIIKIKTYSINNIKDSTVFKSKLYVDELIKIYTD